MIRTLKMISARCAAGKHYIVNIPGINWESGANLWSYAGVVYQATVVLGEPDASMHQAAAVCTLTAISLAMLKLSAEIVLI
jgi:hypothetical protein